MVSFEIFMIGLLVASTFTSLVTEAIKKMFSGHDFTSRVNILTAIVSLIVSAAIGVGYVFVTNSAFNSQNIVSIVVLVIMSWLCAMVGYDKVVQAVGQFKTNKGE